MGAVLQWLSTPEGTAALGVALYVTTSVVARYAPRNSAFWQRVRSWATDYSQRNLTTLPPGAKLSIDPMGDGRFHVVLTIAGKEVLRESFGLHQTKLRVQPEVDEYKSLVETVANLTNDGRPAGDS